MVDFWFLCLFLGFFRTVHNVNHYFSCLHLVRGESIIRKSVENRSLGLDILILSR